MLKNYFKWEIIYLALIVVLVSLGYFDILSLILVAAPYFYFSIKLWHQKRIEYIDNDFFAFLLISFNLLYLGLFSSILIF